MFVDIYSVYGLWVEVVGTDIYIYILCYFSMYILDMEMKTHKVLFRFGKFSTVLFIMHHSFCAP